MSGVTCPSCGHENTVGSRFCSSCGTSLGEDQDTTTATFGPGDTADTAETGEPDAAETPVPEVEVDLSDVPVGTGVLVVTRGEAAGSRILLDLANTSAGRHPKSDIFLDDVTVSRNHALLVRRKDGLYIDDLGSLNGTYVNRRRIESHQLEDGDEIQIGKYKLSYLEK